MYTDDNGIVRFESLDNIAPLQVGLNAALESVSDALDSTVRIWPVANAAERDALGVGTPTKPLFAYRADTGKLEVNDGNGWTFYYNDSNLPYKIATGIFQASVDAANTVKRHTVTYPAGFFTEPPVVQLSYYLSAPDYADVSMHAMGLASFDFNITRKNTNTTNVIWTAVQA